MQESPDLSCFLLVFSGITVSRFVSQFSTELTSLFAFKRKTESLILRFLRDQCIQVQPVNLCLTYFSKLVFVFVSVPAYTDT